MMSGCLSPCHEGAADCRPDHILFSVSLCANSLAHLHASSLLHPFFSIEIKKGFPESYSFCRIKLQNDDIQDFDLRWEQALLLTSDPPSDKVLDLYVFKLQDCAREKTIMALFNQEILRGKGKRDDHRLRMFVKIAY